MSQPSHFTKNHDNFKNIQKHKKSHEKFIFVVILAPTMTFFQVLVIGFFLSQPTVDFKNRSLLPKITHRLAFRFNKGGVLV